MQPKTWYWLLVFFPSILILMMVGSAVNMVWRSLIIIALSVGILYTDAISVEHDFNAYTRVLFVAVMLTMLVWFNGLGVWPVVVISLIGLGVVAWLYWYRQQKHN